MDISLKLEERTLDGKKSAKLRASGYIPSVVYGGQGKSVMTQSPVVETTKVVKTVGQHTPVKLTLGAKKRLAIIKTIDIDPVKHVIRHIAFHAIKQNEIITTKVAIKLTDMSESEAEKAGLVILQAIDNIEVKAKPADLPESLEVSVSNLATMDDKITINDIKLPEGVEFADSEQDMELVIANVYEPGALQAANEAAGGDVEEEAPIETTESESPEKTESNQAEANLL